MMIMVLVNDDDDFTDYLDDYYDDKNNDDDDDQKRPWQAGATEQAEDLRRWESETRFPFFSGPCTPELHHVVHGYLNFQEGMLIRGNI